MTEKQFAQLMTIISLIATVITTIFDSTLVLIFLYPIFLLFISQVIYINFKSKDYKFKVTTTTSIDNIKTTNIYVKKKLAFIYIWIKFKKDLYVSRPRIIQHIEEYKQNTISYYNIYCVDKIFLKSKTTTEYFD